MRRVVLLVTLLLLAGVTPALAAQPTPTSPKACSNTKQPPPPVDASEEPRPGQQAPKPLPVPDKPVGGERMGECRRVLPDSGLRPPTKVNAASWIVVDLDSGDVLAAKDPHGRQRPASLIKVLLALVVLDELRPEQRVRASKLDASQECTCIGIREWQRYSVHDLFTSMIIRSGNDVAHALGSAIGGIPAALRKMNAKARAIGALDTRAATTSGLDGPGMTTSAYDQALIFRAAIRQPAFAKAVSTREMRFKTHRRKPSITVYNDNKLLGQPGYPGYPGFLGGKTGFTDDARHTYVGAARRGGKQLAVVLLRGEQRPLRMSEQGRRLLDYGFRLAARGTEPVGALVTKPAADAPKPNPAGPSADPGASTPAAGSGGVEEGTNTTVLVAGVIILIALLGGFALRRRTKR